MTTDNTDRELTQSNELRDEELDAVTGGIWFLGYSAGTRASSVDHSSLQITKLVDSPS